MVKVKECPYCNCVMECTAWHFDEDAGSKQNHGDFDCRNCNNVVNNEQENVFSIQGYASELFEDVADDMKFEEFIDKYEDRVRDERTVE